MIAALAIHGLLTTAVLLATAAALDPLLRRSAASTRFLWLAAMLASAGLLLVAPLRTRDAAAPSQAGAAESAIAVDRPPVLLGLGTVASEAAAELPRWLERALATLWMGGSLGVAFVLAVAYRRQRQLLRRSPRDVIAGVEVHVSDLLGPAVLGIGGGAVIVPRWLQSRSAAEQRLVLTHELAHREAGDARWLWLAAATLVVMPWNPLLWWGLRRFRLATELDCDQRVLAGGVATRDYGALLIDLTSAAAHARGGMLAFSPRPSQLEARVRAMTTSQFGPRGRRVARFTAGLAVLTAFGIACSSELQRSVEPSDGAAAAVQEVPLRPGDAPAPGTLPPDASSADVSENPVFFDFQVERTAAAIPGSSGPRYPTELRSAGVEGEVLIQFVVNEQGNVLRESVRTLKASHPEFEQSVLAALPQMRFTPAQKDGQPVPQLVQQPFVFQLKR